MPERFDYIRDGQEIYRRSSSMIRSESRLSGLSFWEERVSVRMIHACGQPEIAADVRFSPDFAEAARGALLAGAPILCDAKMVANGVTRSRLPAGERGALHSGRPSGAHPGGRPSTTRAPRPAWSFGDKRLADAVVVIGNAPTALFHLLERLQQGWPKPAAIHRHAGRLRRRGRGPRRPWPRVALPPT